MVVPRLVASATSGFDSSSTFFTDGSKGETCAVFTSEMVAIFVALIRIRARRTGRYLILIA
jgi:hypothetical protein